jgi:uncharacterized protein YoxC
MEQALDFNLIIAIAFGILGIVLIALWIALPFAVFRIKQRLDETNRHLEAIVEQLKALTAAGATPSLDETNRHLKVKALTAAGATPSLDETNRHLKVIVERLRSQTEATLNRKKPVKTRAGGRVSKLYRGIAENDEDD